MSARQFIFLLLGLIVPWLVIIAGIMFNIQNIGLYVGAIVWFGLGLIFTMALY